MKRIVCAVALLLLACSSQPSPERAGPASEMNGAPSPAAVVAQPPPAPDLSKYQQTAYEVPALPFTRGFTSIAVGHDSELWATGWISVKEPGRPARDRNLLASSSSSNPGQWVVHDTIDGSRLLASGSVITSPDSTSWVPAGKGIARLDSAQRPRLIDLPDRVQSIAAAPDGSLWAGGSTIYHLVDGKVVTRFEGTDAPMEKGLVHSVAVTLDGTVWASYPTWYGIAPEPGPIARLDGDSWTVLTKDDGAPGDGMRDLAVAPDGSLWAIVERLEVSSYRPPVIGHFDGGAWETFESYSAGMVDRSTEDVAMNEDQHGTDYRAAPVPYWNALTIAPDGTVWVGGNRGLAAYDGKDWRAYPMGPVQAVAVDPGGTIWVGQGKSLVKFTPPE